MRAGIACAVVGLTSMSAGALELNGYLGVEQRGFLERGMASARSGVSSFVLEPELVARAGSGRAAFIVRPFQRWDAEDGRRTHFDLRELAVEIQRGELDFRAGSRKVFWGVAESQHVVDVINQTDLVESLDLEEKLGQPMINVTWRPRHASFELYVLPRFREREFKEVETRLGPPLPVAGAAYESADRRKHMDFAARAQFAPREELSVALSQFHGTNREPQLLLRATPQGGKLVPYYSIMRQTGLELQWTQGSLALKHESFYRAERGADTFRTVYGLEYTLFQLGESRRDLGLILEHNYDSRLRRAATALQNDLFVGTRLSFNNETSSELIAGVFRDLEHHSVIGKIEWQHRLAAALTLTLNVYTFHRIEQPEPLYVNRNDSFIELGVNYHL